MEKQKNKKLGQIMKKLMMKIIFSKVFLILIIVVLVSLILVSAIKYILDLDIAVYDDKKKGNVPFEVSEYIKGAKIDENGIYFEKEDASGKAERATVEDLWKSIINSGTDLDKYLDNYEQFEKLIDAEVITQFPHIGVGDGKLDGSIKFQRHFSDNNEKTLSYISSDTFDKYINSGDEKVLNYFTLDSDGNAIIAVKNEQKESLSTDDPSCNPSDYSSNLGSSYSYEKVSIDKQSPINYKMYVQQYTMPFQFLWSLLIIGQDKDFVLELADLVENSDIVISIYDNETKTDITEVHTREETVKVKKQNDGDKKQNNDEKSSKNDNSEDEYEEKKVTYTTTYKSTTITDTPEIVLTRANVWIVDYEQEYEYKDDTTPTSDDNTQEGENKKVKSSSVTETRSYVSKPAKTTQKDDKDSSYPNFVNILLKPKYKYTKDNIVSSADELFEILEKNPDTSNMVDLMKYLLYKVTGVSYGVTDYDFSEYESGSFSDVTNIYGSNFEEKVWFALTGAGYSEYATAGAMGNFQHESGFKANNLQNSYEGPLGMSDETYTTAVNNGTYKNFVNDGAGYGLAQWTSPNLKKGLYEYTKSKGVGIDDEDAQIGYLFKYINDRKWNKLEKL